MYVTCEPCEPSTSFESWVLWELYHSTMREQRVLNLHLGEKGGDVLTTQKRAVNPIQLQETRPFDKDLDSLVFAAIDRFVKAATSNIVEG